MSRYHWYKRYPADFIQAVVGLSLEEKGAYSVVLDLIYARGRPIPDDARYVAGVCGCSVRKWNAIKEALISAGKIIVSDGLISNPRASVELGALAITGDNIEINPRKVRDNFEIISRKVGDKNAENEPTLININNLEKSSLTYARNKEAEADTEAERKPPISPQTVEPVTATTDPPERAEPLGLAETELIGLKAGIMAAFREAGSMTLAPDTYRAATWLAQGHKPAIILATIREVLARKPNVKTLSYFDNPIREAHETAAKTPAGASQPMDEGKRLNALRGLVERWQKSPGSWPHGLGPQPDQPDTRIPGNILAEFGIKPATRRAA